MSVVNAMLRDLDARAAVADVPVFGQYLRSAPIADAPQRPRRGLVFLIVVAAAVLGFAASGDAALLRGLFGTPEAPRIPIVTGSPPSAAPAASTDSHAVLNLREELDGELPSDWQIDGEIATGFEVPVAKSRHLRPRSMPFPHQSVAQVERRPESRRASAGTPDMGPGVAAYAEKIASTSAIAIAPAEAAWRRAALLLHRGQRAGAAQALRAALEADPAHVAARRGLIAMLLEEGNAAQAEALALAGLRTGGADAQLALIAARLALERGDAVEALKRMEEHAAAGQQSGEYRAFAGALYYRLRRAPEAVREYAVAVRAGPDRGLWWMGYAMALELAGETRDAALAYDRARESGVLEPAVLAYVQKRIAALR